jgi:hypothetical protein
MAAKARKELKAKIGNLFAFVAASLPSLRASPPSGALSYG